jgi:hypothetical protein
MTAVEIPPWAERPGWEWRLLPALALDTVMSIDPADSATTSRDYGRGFAHAIRLVHALLAPCTCDQESAPRPDHQPDCAASQRGKALT